MYLPVFFFTYIDNNDRVTGVKAKIKIYLILYRILYIIYIFYMYIYNIIILYIIILYIIILYMIYSTYYLYILYIFETLNFPYRDPRSRIIV